MFEQIRHAELVVSEYPAAATPPPGASLPGKDRPSYPSRFRISKRLSPPWLLLIPVLVWSRCGPVYKHVRFHSAVTYDQQQRFDLLARVKRLAKEYREATGRPLGVTGEVARARGGSVLGLTLAPVRHPGYDAERVHRRAARRRRRLRHEPPCPRSSYPARGGSRGWRV